MKGYIKKLLRESLIRENFSSEDLIDIIDIDPSNKRYDKYKNMLKDLYGIDYVEPKIRYKEELKIIKKYDNTAFETKTSKGINVNVVVKKIPNLVKSIGIKVYDESGDIIGRAGFSIDMTNKTIRIGGVTVKSYMRRKGVYSVIVDYIQKIAKENKLKILDAGRSDDAKAFWKNRYTILNKD
jgi:adenylyl- and sulfurtransferase ThiI